MNIELAIAGVGCVALALGHATIGRRWVLPNLRKGSLPASPAGPPSMTLGMVRFTWHIVTVMNLAFSILLLLLAWTADANARTLLLRWFAAFWIAATATALWTGRRRLTSVLRFPVPLLFLVIAGLSWKASM